MQIFLAMLITCMVSCIVGIASICVVGPSMGSGIFGTFFGWPSAIFGIYASHSHADQKSFMRKHLISVIIIKDVHKYNLDFLPKVPKIGFYSIFIHLCFASAKITFSVSSLLILGVYNSHM